MMCDSTASLPSTPPHHPHTGRGRIFADLHYFRVLME